MSEEKKTILLAEDEEDIQEIYSIALAGGGYEVLKAGNGLEVFDRLKKAEGKVDLMVLDIIMPKMDGLEVLEKLKQNQEYAAIPVIMATNLDNEEDRAQALEIGAAEYFLKSRYTPADLVAKVGEILSK
jgi:CheY-like chemotaxis protein